MKDRGFIQSITSGKFHNQIADGVSSARSCILGRQAAETGQEVTWDGLQQNSDVYSLGMDITQFK
jgi:myo-inositol 2-dehydrogenase/D-chiro-inositol 1-dehydrogenase